MFNRAPTPALTNVKAAIESCTGSLSSLSCFPRPMTLDNTAKSEGKTAE